MLRHLVICLSACALLWIAMVPCASAKFYKYRDENGVLHFSDDYGEIPDDSVPEMETLSEPYDHLPKEERERRIQQDRDKKEKLQKKNRDELMRLRHTRQMKEEKLRDRKRQEKAKEMAGETTPFDFLNNAIFVSAAATTDGTTYPLRLLLDTGANVSVIYRPAADRLNLSSQKAGRVKLAGGKTSRVRKATLDSMALGGRRVSEMQVMILEHTDVAPGYDGLLGMDFLKRFPHVIDTKRQLIIWGPPTK